MLTSNLISASGVEPVSHWYAIRDGSTFVVIVLLGSFQIAITTYSAILGVRTIPGKRKHKTRFYVIAFVLAVLTVVLAKLNDHNQYQASLKLNQINEGVASGTESLTKYRLEEGMLYAAALAKLPTPVTDADRKARQVLVDSASRQDAQLAAIQKQITSALVTQPKMAPSPAVVMPSPYQAPPQSTSYQPQASPLVSSDPNSAPRLQEALDEAGKDLSDLWGEYQRSDVELLRKRGREGVSQEDQITSSANFFHTQGDAAYEKELLPKITQVRIRALQKLGLTATEINADNIRFQSLAQLHKPSAAAPLPFWTLPQGSFVNVSGIVADLKDLSARLGKKFPEEILRNPPQFHDRHPIRF